ncbi:MAG TPA: carboxypeptidase-like regulatory domain-containing protein [Candidatus Eisenbacteria bacterium]|nr:carboxypeptidase-like regulatory domain-containing protein [Candidatus Eisenbacteria bacterium]
MHTKRLLALMACAVMFAALQLNAQSDARKKTGATFTGMVLDSNGKPVPGASVMCQTSSGMKPRAVHTDAHGKYFITGLKQDSYDLRASADGAYSDWERNIPMRKNHTKEVTLQLLNGNTALSGIIPVKKKP